MTTTRSLRNKEEFSIVPKGSKQCVVVFHEVWGLVGHTEDVCKRLSKLGFASLAPNLYEGYDDILTPDNIQKAMEALWGLSLEERRDKVKVVEALEKKGAPGPVREAATKLYDKSFRDKLLDEAIAKVEHVHGQFESVATMGFCMGGGLSLKTAVRSPYLKSAVSFYGEPPATEDVGKISVPILEIHASQDEIINGKVPAFVGAMLDAGKDLTLKTFPKTKHGFFNDTRKDVYNGPAAEESWEITKWFFERNLGRH